jgi:DNA-binding transcriptional regulator YiaG
MREPDPTKHRPRDPDYVRELLGKAEISQREAARRLGVTDRTMRHWCAGTMPIPYTAQFALECMADEKTKGQRK